MKTDQIKKWNAIGINDKIYGFEGDVKSADGHIYEGIVKDIRHIMNGRYHVVEILMEDATTMLLQFAENDEDTSNTTYKFDGVVGVFGSWWITTDKEYCGESLVDYFQQVKDFYREEVSELSKKLYEYRKTLNEIENIMSYMRLEC